jgi:hypothetical protein
MRNVGPLDAEDGSSFFGMQGVGPEVAGEPVDCDGVGEVVGAAVAAGQKNDSGSFSPS